MIPRKKHRYMYSMAFVISEQMAHLYISVTQESGNDKRIIHPVFQCWAPIRKNGKRRLKTAMHLILGFLKSLIWTHCPRLSTFYFFKSVKSLKRINCCQFTIASSLYPTRWSQQKTQNQLSKWLAQLSDDLLQGIEAIDFELCDK